MIQYIIFTVASVILLPLVITLVQEFITRRRYGHLPGPRQSALVGNAPEIRRVGFLGCMDDWVARYGRLFTFRIVNSPFVVVADTEAAKTLLFKLTNRANFVPPSTALLPAELMNANHHGLLMAKDDYWRGLRVAWQPAFSTPSLQGYQELFDREALALTAKMEAAAEQGGEVEFFSEITRVTLAVVGTAAYGVDFNSPEWGGSGSGNNNGHGVGATGRCPGARNGATGHCPVAHKSATGRCPVAHTVAQPQQPEQAQQPQQPQQPQQAQQAVASIPLVQACVDFFRGINPEVRSKWTLAALFPCVLPLVRPLAVTFPDQALAANIQARRTLLAASRHLMDGWHAAKSTAAGEGAKAGQPVARTAGGGVAPGSFLGLMLAAREKGSGRALTDKEILAQVETFLLAGFETTANALTFAMYLLARHPDKAARMQRELDEHLPPLEEERKGQQAPLGMDVLDKLVYTEAVLKESMRVYPPVHMTLRLTDKPMEVLGRHIPAGTSLIIPINHIHHQAELWPEHQAFVPERFLPAESPEAARWAHLATSNSHAHLPFGAGSRMCIGFRFAMQEAKTVLARLFQRLDFELSPGQVPLETVPGLTQSPKHGVRVRVHRRTTAGGPAAAAAAGTDRAAATTAAA